MNDLERLARSRRWHLLEGAKAGSPQQVVADLAAVQARGDLPSLSSIAQRLATARDT